MALLHKEACNSNLVPDFAVWSLVLVCDGSRCISLLQHSVLQCVAMCCSVLQCVAVCCSVLVSFCVWSHHMAQGVLWGVRAKSSDEV